MTDDSLQPFAVAVDGPSGSGKSSTARGVARRLGWSYLDTGAMYRALTWWLLSHGVDVNDSEAVAERAGEPAIEISTDPEPGVLIDGHDVTERFAIRASRCSQRRQRRAGCPRSLSIAACGNGRGPIVIEGRDIGTVVVPDAPVKVFLVASPSPRATSQCRVAGHDQGISVETTFDS